ncbi:hypothetical protein FS837_006238, partial [Tulasnella sp. UAMH 9824]
MAGLASIHFSHKALTWHSKLPLDVRHDWFKLESALLDRWSPSGDDDEPPPQPAPPAAPSSSPKGSADQTSRYVIKVQGETGKPPAYVCQAEPNNICVLADLKSAALHNEFLRSDEGTEEFLQVVFKDGSVPSWLAVHWRPATFNLGRGSEDWANVVVVPADTLKPIGVSAETPWKLTAWTVSPSGEVTPVWTSSDNSRKALTATINYENSNLRLVVDPVSYFKGHMHFPTDEKAVENLFYFRGVLELIHYFAENDSRTSQLKGMERCSLT